ncbi:unnamed protein product [Closterium sp. NIES-53]
MGVHAGHGGILDSPSRLLYRSFIPFSHSLLPPAFLSLPPSSDEERQWFNQTMQAAVLDVVQRMKEISMVMWVTEEGLSCSLPSRFPCPSFPFHSLPTLTSDEERQWFNQAMQAAVVDIVQRMKEISMVMAVTEEGLLAQGVTVEEMAGMLEELQEHVESIDMANDLKAIGGLEPLLRFLRSPHAILRARAAEVVTTMVQNNEKSQRSVIEAGGHLTLMDMILNDADVTARTKAVGAISSLVLHNPEGLASLRAVVGIKGLTSLISPTQSPIFLLFSFPSPPPSSPLPPALVRHNPEGLESLRAIIGIKGLTSLITSAAQPTTNTTTSTTSTTTDSTSSATTKLLLKALHLTLYFLQQCPSDRPLALSSGLLTSLLQPGIVGSQDGDVRLAMLRLLQDLACDMTVDTAAASGDAAAPAAAAPSATDDDGGSRRKGDEVSETEAVIGARMQAISALQKRQGSAVDVSGSTISRGGGGEEGRREAKVVSGERGCCQGGERREGAEGKQQELEVGRSKGEEQEHSEDFGGG